MPREKLESALRVKAMRESATTVVRQLLEAACLMTFRAEKARRTAGRGWLPSRQRRGSDREYADRLTGRARV